MRPHNARVLRALCLITCLLAEYLCFSNVPMVPSPGGGPPFGTMASFLPAPPVLAHALDLAQPVVCFPVGTVVRRTFEHASYSSVDTLHGWPRAVFIVVAPLGVQSLHALRLNLLWLSTFNSLIQVAFIALLLAGARRLRRRAAAA